MSRRVAYLVDRARIQRPVIVKDKGVVSDWNSRVVADRGGKQITKFSQEAEPIGDWIAARLRPVDGNEAREEGMVKLAYTHEIVLHDHDESDNEVHPHEGDKIEVRVRRNGQLSDVVLVYKITGAIREHRTRTKVRSYTLPVVLESEF
jgi:transcriptional regulator of NAD metabolism